jgi:two-component system capsular synthesis response regulator RcsB
MFKKVLIAEDFESFNLAVQKTLEEFQIPESDYVNYCDDAFNRLKISILEEKPYDLLITDLSFEEDYREQNLKSGTELIEACKKILPELKVLVFSIEKKSKKIENLFNHLQINAFVSKGRGDAKELKKAIPKIFNNEVYISLDNKKHLKKNTVELSSIEMHILKLLSEGVLQKKIPQYLDEKNVKPSSLSSVEKTINNLKDSLRAKNNEQLIAICKDFGIL